MKALRLLFFCILLGWGLAACIGGKSDVSTRSYILTTGFENGELVYLGVGGDINGMINPTLHAYPGETITVMLVNGGEGTHNIYIPSARVKSQQVTEKGQSAIVTFTVPDQEIDLEYYDSVSNHDVIGMSGILRVSTSPPIEKDNNQSSDQNVGQTTSISSSAVEGEQIFNQKCAPCHTIGGGRLVGPDLEGVAERREIAWIKDFISKPDEMIASGDPIALALLEESNNISMPNPGLSEQDLEKILAFLTPQSGDTAQSPEESTQSGSPAVPQPSQDFEGDPAYGEYLYTGSAALRNGGTPCISCHSVEGVGYMGGGTLGPDLTHVYTRYGKEGLTASLDGLPFPTMQGIFADKQLTASEQANLIAFFEAVDQKGEPRTQQNTTFLLGAGSGLAFVLFGIMLIFWPRQRMSLSDRLRKYGKL